MTDSPLTHRAVVASGWLLLLAVVLMMFSSAYLRGGHPPASGLVNVAILAITYPIALSGTIAGVRTEPSAGSKRFFVMVGVHATFALFVTVLILLRLVLGKSV